MRLVILFSWLASNINLFVCCDLISPLSIPHHHEERKWGKVGFMGTWSWEFSHCSHSKRRYHLAFQIKPLVSSFHEIVSSLKLIPHMTVECCDPYPHRQHTLEKGPNVDIGFPSQQYTSPIRMTSLHPLGYSHIEYAKPWWVSLKLIPCTMGLFIRSSYLWQPKDKTRVAITLILGID